MSQLIELLAQSREKKWCVTPYCTTCGNREFRTAAQQIADMQGDLEALTPALLRPLYYRFDALRIIGIDFHFFLNWERILERWLPYCATDLDFADYALFYIASSVPCGEMRKVWIDQCAALAVEHQHASLLESLILRFPKAVAGYDGLVAMAIELSPAYPRLRRVLLRAGFVVPEADPIKRVRAGRNLFGAVRSGDVLGVEALLRRGADTTLKNKSGQDAATYADSIGKPELAAKIRGAESDEETAMAKKPLTLERLQSGEANLSSSSFKELNELLWPLVKPHFFERIAEETKELTTLTDDGKFYKADDRDSSPSLLRILQEVLTATLRDLKVPGFAGESAATDVDKIAEFCREVLWMNSDGWLHPLSEVIQYGALADGRLLFVFYMNDFVDYNFVGVSVAAPTSAEERKQLCRLWSHRHDDESKPEDEEDDDDEEGDEDDDEELAELFSEMNFMTYDELRFVRDVDWTDTNSPFTWEGSPEAIQAMAAAAKYETEEEKEAAMAPYLRDYIKEHLECWESD